VYAASRSLAIYGRCADIHNGFFLRPEAMEGIKCGAVEPLPDMPKEDGLEVSKQGTSFIMNSM